MIWRDDSIDIVTKSELVEQGCKIRRVASRISIDNGATM